MFLVTQSVRRLIIAFALIVLSIVLFPDHTQPLWDWGKSVGTSLGNDPLPAFETTKGFASMSLLGLALVGIAYNLWRDRRYQILRAEYAHQTGATHLKQKVRELEFELLKARQENEKLEASYQLLNKQYTAALVTAKEYEVHSKYGQEDRATLRDVRNQFEAVLREKSQTKGCQEALDLLLTALFHPADLPEVNVQTNNSSTTRNSRPDFSKGRNALPFGNK